MVLKIIIIIFIWLVGVPVAMTQILYWNTSDKPSLRQGDILKIAKLSLMSWAIYLLYDVEEFNDYLKNKM